MNLLDYLPNNPFSKKPEDREYFFALNISTDKVVGSVWGIEGKKIRVINSSTHKLKRSLDEETGKNEEDLIEAANYALDDALADFIPEPDKILFGVPDSWLQDEELKSDKLSLLKKMVKELGVVPMAYVSTTHAICHLLQKQQGVPVSAILVEVSDPLTISVISSGKIISSKIQKRSENIPQDIEKALMSVSGVEVLPSKLIIYGEDNLNKYKEELLSYSWMSSELPFLHLPKVDTLDNDLALSAVCFAGAIEIKPDINFSSNDLVLANAKDGNRKPLTHPVTEDKNHRNLSSIGFVSGDIAEQEDLLQDQDDIVMNQPTQGGTHPNEVPFNTNGLGHNGSFLDKLKSYMMIPFKSISQSEHASNPVIALLTNKFVFLPIIFLIILIGVFVFLPKANITVFIDLRTLEKDAQVIADPAVTEVNESQKLIPAKIVETDQNGSSKGTATGKKKVGDAAKGQVVFYNATSNPIKLAKGTTLTLSDKNLKFTLDEEVASISAKPANASASPSKSSVVNVTAVEIGPDGNIPAGTDLNVSNFDAKELVAKVENALSGGVSKDVTVVTADDQKRLLASLTSDLRKKARDDIQGKLEPGMKILEEALTENIVRQSYSKQVGDQASDFTLNLTVRMKGTAYNENDLKMIVSKLVETNVPDGYTLDLSNTETQADVGKVEKDGRLVFNAKFRAKLMPKVNVDNLKKELTFKTPEQVAERVRQIENVIGSNVEISPSLPAFLQRTPVLSKNISLEVTAK